LRNFGESVAIVGRALPSMLGNTE